MSISVEVKQGKIHVNSIKVIKVGDVHHMSVDCRAKRYDCEVFEMDDHSLLFLDKNEDTLHVESTKEPTTIKVFGFDGCKAFVETGKHAAMIAFVPKIPEGAWANAVFDWWDEKPG
jgi:hypothetical protein